MKFFELFWRIIVYAAARSIPSNVLHLYMVIMHFQNSNYWKPCMMSENWLCFYAQMSHTTFIKCRRVLVEHNLIIYKTDGVTTPQFSVKYAPVVHCKRAPAVNVTDISSRRDKFVIDYAKALIRAAQSEQPPLIAEPVVEYGGEYDEIISDESISVSDRLQYLKDKIKTGG